MIVRNVRLYEFVGGPLDGRQFELPAEVDPPRYFLLKDSPCCYYDESGRGDYRYLRSQGANDDTG